ncbi:Ribophorin I [Pluteus cervinus]|uniref:Ribophorin I n=1 Tax=Pluteus cervinus TaxID=181527 RepID=A0ACD3BE42_9AGAR|nr:Ribophorin I [Pluteus cervinus]
MALRWCTSLPVLLLSYVVCSLAVEIQSFENTNILRTVELGGSQVQITTTFAIKALQPNAKTYTLALDVDEQEKTSWLEVRLKGQQEGLEMAPREDDTGRYVLLDVTLPKALAVNGTANLIVDSIQTGATFPWPEKAAQAADQALKYRSDLFVISPYKTVTQKTKLRSPSPGVISHTTPKNVESFTLGDPVTKSGATITYGPYQNIPASANSKFLDEHQQRVIIHYSYEHPVLEVTKLKRAAEISHWGSNLNIQDEVVLRNAGPTLKGQFSRIDYQHSSYYKKSVSHVIPAVTLHLPAGIRDAYYYDQIGNVSTSRLRTTPSVPKGSQANQYSFLELRPRYPIMGGWNYSFTLGWDAPLADSTSYDSKSGKYIVEVPVMTTIPGAVVKEAEVKIVLPEGATDISYVEPFPSTSWMFTYKTYLDTSGRPTLLFEYQDLTIKHAQSIYVSYKVPFSAHLQKPFAVSAAIFISFMFTLVGRRIDLTLHKQKVQ